MALVQDRGLVWAPPDKGGEDLPGLRSIGVLGGSASEGSCSSFAIGDPRGSVTSKSTMGMALVIGEISDREYLGVRGMCAKVRPW